MKSNGFEESPKMIEKTTEALWRVLWFLVYIIFIPTLVAVLFFFIFGFILIYAFGIEGLVTPIALSAITFLVSILVFYKPFDKYRKNSIFKNKTNNPRVRIHMLFLITLISLIYTPVFLIFAPEYQQQLSLLPLITFIITYNSVYLYFYSQPIDFFNIKEKKFEHFRQFKDTIKQPYNLIIFINYLVHILFLSYTFDMQLFNINISWSLAFVSNIIFYIITLVSTKPYFKKIESSILNKESFLEELVLFKQSFIKSINFLDFLIMIEIPFGILSFFFQIWYYDAIINAVFISVILLIFNFKLNIYIKSYYIKQLARLKPDKYDSKEFGIKGNFGLTLLFIILIPCFIFYYSITIGAVILNFNFLALPVIYFITRMEEKYHFLPRKNSRHLYLFNTLLLLAVFSFQIMSIYFNLFIQFAIFFISLYFSLEIFVKYDYYKKKNILVAQNIIAISGFYCLAYIFFEFAFVSGPTVDLNSFMLNYILPGLIGTLFSFYLLYFRQFYKNSGKSLRISFIMNFIFISALSFYLLNLELNFINMIISIIGFSFLYLIFSAINYAIHLFNKQNLVNNLYSTMWFLDFSVFSAMLFSTLMSPVSLLTIIPDFIVLSALILFTLWFGKKIGKLNESNYYKLFNVNGFFFIFEIFILISQFFITEVFPALFEFKVLAYFISTFVTALIINIGAPSKSSTIKKTKIIVNIFTVIFGWFVLEMFYFLANFLNFYFIYGLIIFSSIITAIPIGFLVLIGVLEKKRLVDYLFLVLNIICLSFFSFLTHFFISTPFFDFFGVTFIILSLIISYIAIGKVGVKLGYISEDFYIKFLKLMYYPIGILVFLVIFSWFLIFLDPFLSFLIAALVLSGMTNFANLLFKTIEKINTRITLLALFYGAFYISINIIIQFVIIPRLSLSISEWYINLYASVLPAQLIFYIPFRYLAAENIIKLEIFFKYSYYSLFSIILVTFLLIASYFFDLFFINAVGFYVLGLIADITFLTITLYQHIKRGLLKKYLRVIHISKRTALILYSTLFTEFYAFLLTLILLLFMGQGPIQIWQLWFSCYIAFILITFVIRALASNLIIFNADFSRRMNFIALTFTAIIFTYFSLNIVGIVFNNPFLQWDLILLVFLFFLLLPSYYSIKQRMFQKFFNQKFLYFQGITISILIVLLPTLIAIEYSILISSFQYLIIATSILFYCFLKYMEHIFDLLSYNPVRLLVLKTIQLICWNFLSTTITFTIYITFVPNSINQLFYFILTASILIFFIINSNSLNIIEDIKQRVFENQDLGIDYYKIYKIYEFYKNVSFFGLIFTVSGFLTNLISPLLGFLINLNSLLIPFNFIIQFGTFSLIVLLFLISTNKIEIEYQKTRSWILLIMWISIKAITCSIIYTLTIQISLFMAWSSITLIFSILSPITMYFIKTIRLVFGTTNDVINGILLSLFYSSLILNYISYFWNFVRISPYFVQNPFLMWLLLFSNLFIFIDYISLRLKELFQGRVEFNILKLYFKSILLIFLFIYFNFYLNLILWFSYAIILLIRRNSNILVRSLSYISLTFNFYLYILIDFISPNLIELRYLTIILSGSLICVLLISVLSNRNKVNDFEKFTIYVLLSLISFISFSLIPHFPLLYNSTFSLLIFLILTANYYYRKGDKRYKLFIRPCVVLGVFDFTSFIFYGLLFNIPPYAPDFQYILSFTSTFSLTGFTFISLYNQSPQRFRTLSFFVILPLLTLSVPVFVYYFTYVSFPILQDTIIPLTVSFNIGIIFFFIAIGLYQWRFSRVIWKTGFWAWILFPIVNYALINQSFASLGLRSLELFGFVSIPASTLLAITVCIILSFPFWYTWIKDHFTTILFAAWIINLGLLYWFSQSLFFGNDLLVNFSFLIFAFILLMPLVYKLKIWRVLMAFWILFTFVTISFINFIFLAIDFAPQLVLSIDISALGLSLIFLSYFPNMKNKRILSLLIAYFILMTGISIMIYNIIFISIFLEDPLGSLYLTLIIISGLLFSSRFLKINKILINFLISWIFIASFALLTFHIYGILLGFYLEAFYFALTIGGVTFFIFNRYKMLWGPYENLMPVSSMIAFTAISLGISLSACSLVNNFTDFTNPWFLIVSLFLFINLIFISLKLKSYKYVLGYILPIPITLFTIHFFLFFEPLNDALNLSLSGIIIYTLTNQFFKIKNSFKSILRLVLYLSIILFSYVLPIYSDPILNIFISMLILFTLTFFDNLLSRKRKYWYIVLLNLLSYLFSTIFLYWYLNSLFIEIFESMIWLNTFIFILLQKYTSFTLFTILKSLNKYDQEKLVHYRSLFDFILSNSLYVLISLFGSLSFASIISNEYSISVLGSSFLSLTLFFFIYFILNSIFNRRVKTRIRNGTRFGLFLAFQISLFGFWLFSLASFPIFDLTSILIIETILTYNTFNLLSNISTEREDLKRFNYTPFLTYILYIEIAIYSFSWFFSYLNLELEYSLMYSISIFFILTLIDLGLIKKINVKLMKFSHLVSYAAVSVFLFYVALNILFVESNAIAFNLIIICFLIMQFYTIRALFSYFNHYTFFNQAKALKIRQMTNNVLINAIFILSSILGSQIFQEFLVSINEFFLQLETWIFLSSFSFLIFFLNGTLNRTIEKELRIKSLLIPSYIAMQVFLLGFLFNLMVILNEVNLNIFWLGLIALVETIFSIYPVYIARKYSVKDTRKVFISKLFKILDFCLYLEITLLSYGLFYFYSSEPFLSLLYSQFLLFGLSILEINLFKSFKEQLGYLMHLLSFVIISVLLIYLVFILPIQFQFSYLPIILMQFYSNYIYYKLRRDKKPVNLEKYQKWAIRRQRIIGNIFYAVLIVLVSRELFLATDLEMALFLISLLIHIVALIDRSLLIFFGRLSMSIIVISLVAINIFTIPFLFTVILSTPLKYKLTPLIIFILGIELFYLTKLTKKWNSAKKLIISTFYFNFSSWPLYFIRAELYLDFNLFLVLFAFFLLFLMVKIDSNIKAIGNKLSKALSSISLFILGVGFPIYIYIILNTFDPSQLIFNIAIAVLIATIELGIIKKPYKRKRGLSFFYTLSLLIETLVITHEIDIYPLGYSILVLGILIYLYMFMLEELKNFFSNIVDYIAKGFNTIKKFINKILTSIYNFLKNNYTILKFIFAGSIGIILGYISTITPLFLNVPLRPYDHAPLFGLAIFGLIIGLFPGKKSEDPDDIFRTRMIRFSSVWIGITIVIFVFIIPEISEDLIQQAFFILSSFVILGLIFAVYVWRIEKKQKISIKWRFYITVILIIMLIVWGILIVLLII